MFLSMFAEKLKFELQFGKAIEAGDNLALLLSIAWRGESPTTTQVSYRGGPTNSESYFSATTSAGNRPYSSKERSWPPGM